MIQSYVKETGQPIVSFRGNTKELKDDLVRIMYTMARRDSSSHRAMIDACNEVDAILKRDAMLSCSQEPITEAADEH